MLSKPPGPKWHLNRGTALTPHQHYDNMKRLLGGETGWIAAGVF